MEQDAPNSASKRQGRGPRLLLGLAVLLTGLQVWHRVAAWRDWDNAAALDAWASGAAVGWVGMLFLIAAAVIAAARRYAVCQDHTVMLRLVVVLGVLTLLATTAPPTWLADRAARRYAEQTVGIAEIRTHMRRLLVEPGYAVPDRVRRHGEPERVQWQEHQAVVEFPLRGDVYLVLTDEEDHPRIDFPYRARLWGDGLYGVVCFPPG